MDDNNSNNIDNNLDKKNQEQNISVITESLSFYNDENINFVIHDNKLIEYIYKEYPISRDIPSNKKKEHCLQNYLDAHKVQPIKINLDELEKQIGECITLLSNNKIIHCNITPSNIYCFKEDKFKLTGFEYAKKIDYNTDEISDEKKAFEKLKYFLKIAFGRSRNAIKPKKDNNINSVRLYRFESNFKPIPYYFRIVNLGEIEKALSINKILNKYMILCKFQKRNTFVIIPFNSELEEEGQILKLYVIAFDAKHLRIDQEIIKYVRKLFLELINKTNKDYRDLLPDSVLRLIEFSKSIENFKQTKKYFQGLEKGLFEILKKTIYYDWSKISTFPIDQSLIKFYGDNRLSEFFSGPYEDFLKILYFQKLFSSYIFENQRRSILNKIHYDNQNKLKKQLQTSQQINNNINNNNINNNDNDNDNEINNIYIPKHKTQVQREIIENRLDIKKKLFREYTNNEENDSVKVLIYECEKIIEIIKLDDKIKEVDKEILYLKNTEQSEQLDQSDLPSQETIKKFQELLLVEKNKINEKRIELGKLNEELKELKENKLKHMKKINDELEQTYKDLNNYKEQLEEIQNKLLKTEQSLEELEEKKKEYEINTIRISLNDSIGGNSRSNSVNTSFNNDDINNSNNSININNSSNSINTSIEINNISNNNNNIQIDPKEMTNQQVLDWFDTLKYKDQYKFFLSDFDGEILFALHNEPEYLLEYSMSLNEDAFEQFKIELNKLFEEYEKNKKNKIIIKVEVKENSQYINIIQWNNEDVCDWLSRNNVLINLIGEFKNNLFNGEKLIEIFEIIQNNNQYFQYQYQNQLNIYGLNTIGYKLNFKFEFQRLFSPPLNQQSELLISNLKNQNILKYSSKEIGEILKQNNLPKLVQLFEINHINGIAFIQIKEDDMNKIGIIDDNIKIKLNNLILSNFK